MRWIAAAAMLCLSAGARAEKLCGVGEASGGGVEARLLASAEDGSRRVTYFQVKASNPDGTYELTVDYDPAEAGPGAPKTARVDIHMPVPDPGRAEPEQIEWRAGAGPWSNPGYWGTPRRTSGDPKEVGGSVQYTIPRSPVRPSRTELSETLGPGVRWEFRRLDRSGRVIGAGSVDYPPSRRIAELYGEVRAEAMARLGPCMTIALPPVVPPAPLPPPAPPVSGDPAVLDARACADLRGQPRTAEQKDPQTGRRMKVEQKVDCRGRSLTWVLEMEPFGEAEREGFSRFLQSMSDQIWCSSPYYRRLIGRGWTFRLEIRGPGDRTGIHATTRKCPG